MLASEGLHPLFDDRTSLIFTTLLYGFLVVAAYKWLSFAVMENFYVFSEADSFTYHTESLVMSQLSFVEAFTYLTDYYYFDDWGAFIVTTTLYKIIESQLIVNAFYVVLGTLTAVRLYDLAGLFVTKKYAFIVSLLYSLSSYTLFFHATSLKESIMVFLTVSFFYYYYRFLQNNLGIMLFFALGMATLMLFFRPAISMLLAGAGIIGFLLQNRHNRSSVFLVLVMMIVVVVFFGGFQSAVDKYTMSGDLDRVIDSKDAQGAIKGGGLLFNYVVIFLGQTLGPFPTFSPDASLKLALWAPGLLVRVLLFLPFWLGVGFILKNRLYQLFPIVLFVTFEMFSLIVIMEGLELRKGMPHMPFIYLIAFWFIDQLQRNSDSYSQAYFTRLIHYSMVGALAFILLYNLRS